MVRIISHNRKVSLYESLNQKWLKEKVHSQRCLIMMICAVYNHSLWIKKMIGANSQIEVVILIARIVSTYVQGVRDLEGILLTASMARPTTTL